MDGEKAAEDADLFSKELASVSKTEREGAALKIWALKPEETLLDLFKFTKEKSYGVEQVSIREMSLEDVFISFTGKEWRD